MSVDDLHTSRSNFRRAVAVGDVEAVADVAELRMVVAAGLQ